MEYSERFKKTILNGHDLYTKCRDYLINKGLENVISSSTADAWTKTYVFDTGVVFREHVNALDPVEDIVSVVEKVLLLDENGMWED